MTLESALVMASGSPLGSLMLLILFFVVSGVFIWLGSWFAQIKKRSLARAIAAAFLTSLVSSIFLIPFANIALIALILSLLIDIWIIKMVFITTWRKSLVAWVFSVIAHVVVLLGFIFLA